MKKNLDELAKSLFDQIRSQIPKIKMEDSEGSSTIEPKKARFFEFNYIVEGSVFGLVNIDISEDDGVTVIFPNDITEGQTKYNKKQWFNFLKEIRECARQHLTDFNVRDISKQVLDKRDKEFMSSSKEENMSESKLFGTSKTSYQDLGNSKLIVRHSAPVNYNHPAGRTQRIESIYIENSQGERFKYPMRHLNGARALAQHVGQGGTPYDSIGQYVVGLSEELGKLRFFKNYVERTPSISESMSSVNTKVVERIDQIKKEIAHLQNANHYKAFAESFTENEKSEIPDDILNDWVDRLTVRSFNEDLKSVFPYIYKLVDESELPVKELDISEIIDSYTEEDVETNEDKEISEFQSYLEFIDSIKTEEEQNKDQSITIPASITPDAAQIIIDQLNQGIPITDLLKGETSAIPEDALEGLKSVVANMAIDMEMLDEKEINDISEKIAEKLYTTSQSTPEPAPAAEPAPAEEQPAAPPEAAPAAPAALPPSMPMTPGVAMAETLIKLITKAKKAGATENTKIRLSNQEMTIGEAILKAGMQVESFFGHDDKHDNGDEIVEYIKSMFDAETGRFPKGETGVLIACEKKFGEGAVDTAKKIMNELVHTSELDRIQELAGQSNVQTDESGLQYYTGKKKYGKDGMAALAAAGREGASEEELGRIKDQYQKEDLLSQLKKMAGIR